MPALLTTALLAAACTGGKGGDDDDDDGPQPPFALRFPSIPEPRQETATSFTVNVTTTDGSAIIDWDGEITVTSGLGPVSPATIDVVDGVGVAGLVFEIAGNVAVTFDGGADLIEQLITFNVLPRIPVPIAGAGAHGSVIAEGTGWDSDGAWSPAGVLEGAGVRVYYASSTSGGAPNIGTAYAADGVAFVKAASPVVGPAVAANACHTDGADHPAAVRLANGSVLLLYEGRAGSARHLCAATSGDGVSFTPLGLAIDVAPAAGSFDSGAITGAALTLREDGTLLAYYAGTAMIDVDAQNAGDETVTGIGTAVSTNGGVSWTKVPGQVYGAHLTSYAESTNLNSWDGLAVYKPGVLRDGGVYRVWVSGMSGLGRRIGLYETTDPFTFNAHVDNLESELHEIVSVGEEGSFDDDGTEHPSVIEHGGVRRIYYTGTRAADGIARIGSATFP